MLSVWSGVSVETRAKQYGLTADVVTLGMSGEKDVLQCLEDFLHEKYVLYVAELEQSLKFYTKFWNNDGCRYVEAAEKVM